MKELFVICLALCTLQSVYSWTDCSSCKQFVATTKQLFAAPRTAETTQSVFEGICFHSFNTQQRVFDCYEFARTNVPKFFETIKIELDETALCGAEEQCNMDELSQISLAVRTLVQNVMKNPEHFDLVPELMEYFQFNDVSLKALIKTTCTTAIDTEHSAVCSDVIDVFFKIFKPYLVSQFSDGKQCSVCHLAQQYLNIRFKDQELEKSVEDLASYSCNSILGISNSTCHSFIRQSFGKYWQILIQGLTNRLFCRNIGVCKSVPNVNSQQGLTLDTCSTCKSTFSYFVNGLLSKEVVQGWTEYTIAICDSCPGKSQCIKFVKQNHGKFYRKYVSGMDNPYKACESMGLCIAPVSSDKFNHSYIQHTIFSKLPIFFKWVSLLQNPSSLHDFMCNNFGLCTAVGHQVNAKTSVSINCVVCRKQTNFIKNGLLGDGTLKALKKVSLAICNAWPSKQYCLRYQESYAVLSYKMLLNYLLDVKYTCEAYHFCHAGEANGTLPYFDKADECQVCKANIQQSRNYLLSGKALKYVSNQAIGSCDYCSGKESCIRAMDKNAITVYSKYVQMMDPAMSCQGFGICPKMSEKYFLTGTNQCSKCKSIISEAVVDLLSDKVIGIAKTRFRNVCNFFPDPSPCLKFMDVNFEKMYKRILTSVNPLLICKAVAGCKSFYGMDYYNPFNGLYKTDNLADCRYCWVVNKVIQEFLLKKFGGITLCKQTSTDYRECLEFSKLYNDQFMQMIVNQQVF